MRILFPAHAANWNVSMQYLVEKACKWEYTRMNELNVQWRFIFSGLKLGYQSKTPHKVIFDTSVRVEYGLKILWNSL